MLPMTLQFLIVMIASAINDRLQRKPDYVEDERSILREQSVLCEKWVAQNRCDIDRFSSVPPERSSANPWFWARSCLPES
jgi:hypothetical protein